MFAFLFIDLSNPPSEGRVVYLLSYKPLYFLSIQRVLDIFRGLLFSVQHHFLLRKDIASGRIAFCSLRLPNLLSRHYLYFLSCHYLYYVYFLRIPKFTVVFVCV